MKNNFTAKHLWEYNKPKQEIDKKKEQKLRPKKFKNTGEEE